MSKYAKIKFDTNLSDFTREQIAKVFLFTHSFHVNEASFKERWERYSLPLPEGYSDISEILDVFSSVNQLGIQDHVTKLLVDYNDARYSTICIYMNDAMTVLDRQIAEYKQKNIPTCEDMASIVRKEYESIVMINSWLFSFQINATNDDDLDLEHAKMFYPHVGFLSQFQNTIGMIETIDYVEKEKLEEDIDIKVLSLHSLVLTYTMLVHFSMLCGLMMDAFCASLRYGKALINIQRFIQFKYHNFFLYRVELPLSATDESKPIAQRGSSDHTTMMKIYLFDRHQKPVLLRIDLPHAGSEFLHINLSTSKGEKLDMDHYEIPCDQSPENITPVFESLRQSMEFQTPNLFKVVDSELRDEQMVFSEMEKFVDYHELCMKIFTKEDYTRELNKVGGYLKIGAKPYDVKEVLTKAYHFFCAHPFDE